MAKWIRQGCILLLAVVAADAIAQEARTWLDRMNRAVEELSYEGTFVHVFGGNAEILHIAHRNSNGRVDERIVSRNGSGREIIRRGDKVQCILPDREVTFFVDKSHDSASPLVSALPSYSDELDPYYDFKMYRTSRVANRPTQIIGIRPKDEFRYGYLLWLDEETAMPLKSQLRNDNGDIVEQIFFTEIEFSGKIPDSALEPATDTKGFTLYRPPPPGAEDEPAVEWRASMLPSGFRLSAATQRPMAGSKYPVDHLVYTDGLATVSVFIENPKANTDVEEGFSKLGSTNAYSLTLRGRKVTAIGEVPRQTVHRIATSLTPE